MVTHEAVQKKLSIGFWGIVPEGLYDKLQGQVK
jgi:hypothetical protein